MHEETTRNRTSKHAGHCVKGQGKQVQPEICNKNMKKLQNWGLSATRRRRKRNDDSVKIVSETKGLTSATPGNLKYLGMSSICGRCLLEVRGKPEGNQRGRTREAAVCTQWSRCRRITPCALVIELLLKLDNKAVTTWWNHLQARGSQESAWLRLDATCLRRPQKVRRTSNGP